MTKGLSSAFKVILCSVCIHSYFHCFIACKCSRIWSNENAYWL